MIGEERLFGKLRFRCIASRSTKDRAEILKKRLTRIGTIQIRVVKRTSRVVGVPPVYWIYARPGKSLGWEKLDRAIERLL